MSGAGLSRAPASLQAREVMWWGENKNEEWREKGKKKAQGSGLEGWLRVGVAGTLLLLSLGWLGSSTGALTGILQLGQADLHPGSCLCTVGVLGYANTDEAVTQPPGYVLQATEEP